MLAAKKYYLFLGVYSLFAWQFYLCREDFFMSQLRDSWIINSRGLSSSALSFYFVVLVGVGVLLLLLMQAIEFLRGGNLWNASHQKLKPLIIRMVIYLLLFSVGVFFTNMKFNLIFVPTISDYVFACFSALVLSGVAEPIFDVIYASVTLKDEMK